MPGKTFLGRWLAEAAAHVGHKGEHAAGVHRLLPGVDLSSYQGDPAAWRNEAGSIDWAACKFTELRAGNSRYLNPYALTDFAYLKAHGKGRVAYLFGHPGAPASDTVSFFAAEVARAGLDDGDGVALDLEVADGLSPARVSDWAQDVTARLEREFGRLPLVYVNRSFALGGYCAGLQRCPLWLADPDVAAGHPRVPRPWKTWAVHQWSWQPLDRDVARFTSLADMRRALGKKEAVTVVTADGKTSLHDLVVPHEVSVMHALRLTAEHFGKFEDGLYDYGNGVFAGRLAASAPLKRGTQVAVKKGS